MVSVTNSPDHINSRLVGEAECCLVWGNLHTPTSTSQYHFIYVFVYLFFKICFSCIALTALELSL